MHFAEALLNFAMEFIDIIDKLRLSASPISFVFYI